MNKNGTPANLIPAPRKVIDPEAVKRLGGILCTNEEIAAVLGCSPDTIARNFQDVADSARMHGKASLRRMMYKQAARGNVTAQIWLSKQYLGMRDMPKDEGGRTVFIPMPAEYIEAVNRALGFTGELKPLGEGQVIEAKVSDVLPE